MHSRFCSVKNLTKPSVGDESRPLRQDPSQLTSKLQVPEHSSYDRSTHLHHDYQFVHHDFAYHYHVHSYAGLQLEPRPELPVPIERFSLSSEISWSSKSGSPSLRSNPHARLSRY